MVLTRVTSIPKHMRRSSISRTVFVLILLARRTIYCILHVTLVPNGITPSYHNGIMTSDLKRTIETTQKSTCRVLNTREGDPHTLFPHTADCGYLLEFATFFYWDI